VKLLDAAAQAIEDIKRLHGRVIHPIVPRQPLTRRRHHPNLAPQFSVNETTPVPARPNAVDTVARVAEANRTSKIGSELTTTILFEYFPSFLYS
jgi:hypothetical protein